MINYAQTEETCIRAVFSRFLEYLPYIMLLGNNCTLTLGLLSSLIAKSFCIIAETLLLVVVEKFTFKIPRIAQKVERFYKNIVEESLFGKDPDVAEDMTDIKTSTEAISRQRQRIEICVTLKRGSLIHDVYIAKNLVEILIVIFFLPLNVSYALAGGDGDEYDSARCMIKVQSFPDLVDQEGHVFFQCRGKKMSFFMLALWIQSALMAIHGLLSIGAIIWCWRFRAVTNLLKTIEKMRKSMWEPGLASQSDGGKDFLFLFDLLAHTCGLESTLRVLTHSDETFHDICRPNLDPREHLLLEEDKLKISWKPADIERWLRAGKKHTRSQRSIDLESYEVTIFPAETIRNTHTLPAKGDDDDEDVPYNAWFYDLQGGRTEYVIT